ncbi:hypothetical protein C8Q80DRAFT_1276577 [Daedaleopsis nitida]|nr:hypothetical protein C8Q80DRAFT_1276577 [Daedaleopsis nitida]
MCALDRFLANEYILNQLFGSSVTFPELNPTYHDPFTVSDTSRPRYNVSLARKTLASAALACRAFSGPASYALWKVIDFGLVPLVHTLPSVKKCVREDPSRKRGKDKPTYFELQGSVSEVEWIRFEHVAMRVRSLALFKDTRLRPEVVQAIVTRYDGHGPPLFPNLQILSWTDSSGDLLWRRMFQIALQSVPRCLTYTCSDSLSSSMSDLDLSIAADVAPTVPHIVFDMRRIYTRANPYLLKFVHLRFLKLKCYLHNRELMEHIASLPHLEPFTCVGVYPGVRDFDPINYGSLTAGFPSLRQLTLWEGASSFTAKTKSTPFINEMCPLPAIQRVKKLSLNIVTERYFEFDPPVEETEGSRDIPFVTLAEPFSRLHNMEDFSFFSSRWRFAVSDGDLSQLADAWPRLATLKIWSSHLRRDRSWTILPPFPLVRPSLYGAIRLAERCPGLEFAKVDLSGVTDEEARSLERGTSRLRRSGPTVQCERSCSGGRMT